MKSGPSRVKSPLRDLFSFGEGDNADTKANKSHAGGALHAKEEVGWGGGAHREWCSVGERGDGERLWVSAWCLRKGAGMGV